jgi:hypothetical protein
MTDNPVREIAREERKLVDIIKSLDIEDIDVEDLALIVDSETNLNEAVIALAEIVQHYEANLIVGLKNRIAALGERKSRMEKSVGTYRALILSVMERIGQDKIVSDLMTLSARNTQRGLVIEDEAAIPAKYWVPQDPRLDRRALLADLKEGGDIKGAHLDNGGRSLTIRTK